MKEKESCPFPIATPETGLTVLKGLARTRSLLTAMEIMHEEVGPAFQITLPGFQPAVMVSPESNRQILISKSGRFQWRNPTDPVTKLLRHGLLVEDGDKHAALRAHLEPTMQKRNVIAHIPAMLHYTDRVLDTWEHNTVQDMLIEMRRVALLIFMGTLLDVDFSADMERLWRPILKSIKYISPGLWIIWPDIPRLGFTKPLAEMDAYLYQIIQERRSELVQGGRTTDRSDLLTDLVKIPEMTDDLIRDQILTMLIAGHDTSTALLAWVLQLLSEHDEIKAQAVAEVDRVVGSGEITADHMNQLPVLSNIIKETLRLYPPIHVSNRMVAQDTEVTGYELQAGTRLMASIYLSHRDKRYWDDPEQFQPERFAPKAPKPPPFTYIPFGGGARTCIGAGFAQVEAKVVLARILQRFALTGTNRPVHVHMGATLEPRPGVFLRTERRDQHG